LKIEPRSHRSEEEEGHVLEKKSKNLGSRKGKENTNAEARKRKSHITQDAFR
jgi:hypothetical protein